MDLDPWLSTLDTTSINPNINTSKTQTVSDNKPAAPVLINGRNVEKLREQHRDRPWTRARSAQSDAGSLCFYWHFFKTGYITFTFFIYHLTVISGGRGDGGGKAGKPSAAVGDCLWMFVGVFNETLFDFFAESQTYIFDVRLAHFQLCLWSQNSCFGSWTKSEQKSQCFKKLRLKIAAKKTVVGGNQRWWEKDSGALWSGTHQWNKAEETAGNRFLQAKENLEHQQGSAAELLQVTRTARCGFTSQRAAED